MNIVPAVAVILSAALAVPAAAQSLVAWPVGSPGWQQFFPGRPMPRPGPFLPGPRPMPIPRPGPLTAPTLPADAAPVTLSEYHVQGSVNDAAAELDYRIVFHNPTDRVLEGVLMVPLPADAALSGFTMTMGGKEVKGELLEASQASSIYQSIVSRAQDPGLLELVGERMFRARVFPIEPHGDITVRLKLTQTLAKSGGLAAMTIPMRSARFLQGTGGKTSARLNLRTSLPIRTLIAPAPGTTIRRSGEREAEIVYEEGAEGPQDLALSFSLRQDPLAAGVLAHRVEGEDGTFLLTLSPKVAEELGKAAPKDVVFVVDRSGSMQEGGKMEQARKALAWCVERLAPQDRFGIVDFATDWNALEDRLLFANAGNKARAQRYIAGLDASGGTNIEAGLDQGLKLLAGSKDRVPMLFFLTDGVPTVGATDPAALLRKASEANASMRARVFSFGVGSDVNTLLLDKLADTGRGARDYVAPGEDIEAKVSSLYQKVSRPALTDLKVEWRGVEAAEVYPRPIPDLFFGSELTLYGRFKAAGKGTLVVTGRSGGKDARFEFPVELPAAETRNDFLPRLWASRKIAHELDALRLSGRVADPEAIDSIVKLAKKYGIVTPYTSFLVTEEGADMGALRRQASARFGEMSDQAMNSGFSGGGVASRAARRASFTLAALRGAAPAASAPMNIGAAMAASEGEAKKDLRAEGRAVVETREVAGKTFYKRGQAWVDGESELPEAASARVVTLEAGSVEYFALIAADPAMARWLSLGEVTVLRRGVVYKITPRS